MFSGTTNHISQPVRQMALYIVGCSPTCSHQVAKLPLVLALHRTQPIRKLTGHSDEVNAIRFDPTRTLLASCSDDHTVRVWTLTGLVGPHANEKASEEETNLLKKLGGSVVFSGHTEEVHSIDWVPGSGVDGRPKLLAS